MTLLWRDLWLKPSFNTDLVAEIYMQVLQKKSFVDIGFMTGCHFREIGIMYDHYVPKARILSEHKSSWNQ